MAEEDEEDESESELFGFLIFLELSGEGSFLLANFYGGGRLGSAPGCGTSLLFLAIFWTAGLGKGRAGFPSVRLRRVGVLQFTC